MFLNIYCIQLTLLGCKFHWFLFIKNSISWQHRLPCPIGNNQVCSLDLIKPTNFPGNDLSSNYLPFCFTKHGAPKIWISSKFGNFPVWAWYGVILLRSCWHEFSTLISYKEIKIWNLSSSPVNHFNKELQKFFNLWFWRKTFNPRLIWELIDQHVATLISFRNPCRKRTHYISINVLIHMLCFVSFILKRWQADFYLTTRFTEFHLFFSIEIHSCG